MKLGLEYYLLKTDFHFLFSKLICVRAVCKTRGREEKENEKRLNDQLSHIIWNNPALYGSVMRNLLGCLNVSF